MTYQEAVDYLSGLVEVRILPGLTRIRQALDALGQPHRSFPHLLVGGTNGKGSTSSFLGSVLTAAGYRVGLYTSPHLFSFRERIRIGDDLLTRKDLPRLVEAVIETGISLSYFEFATAMALVHFARQHVDMAILEVGLGGRWDATNATDPILSVITNVDMDHSEWLGRTVEEVAGEKACIMRPGRPAVLGAGEGTGLDTLLEKAAEMGADALVAGRDFLMTRGPQGLCFKAPGWAIDGLRPGLKGQFQVANAACALASVGILREKGFQVAAEAVRRGIEAVQWPGRFQVIGGPVKLVVDSAHNPAAMKALVESLDLVPSEVIWLFSALSDKDVPGMIRQIPRPTGGVVTVPLDHDRAMSLDDLVAAFRESGLDVVAETGISSGLRKAVEKAGRRGTVIVAGSIFLAAAVLGSWKMGADA